MLQWALGMSGREGLGKPHPRAVSIIARDSS